MIVSIITICFNNEVDILQTLESVVNQSYKKIEYIIIDGGSTDGSMEIIRRYSHYVSKIVSEKDAGIYDAINKGISLSTGGIVGLIHAGDILFDNNVISKIAYNFHENPDLEAIYGHSMIISGEKIIRINKSSKFSKAKFKYGWMPSHQSFYAKRILFERYGLYNLKYKIAADYELLLRFLYVNNINVSNIDEYIIKFRLGGTSTKSLKNIIKMNKECLQAWRDNNLRPPIYLIMFKFLRKIPQFLNAEKLKYVSNKK